MTDFSMETTWDGVAIAQKAPYGAAVVVYRRDPDGLRYLLLHRKHRGPDFAGEWAWGSPAGCRIPAEAVEATARRELLEEAGLNLACHLTTLGNEDWYVYAAEASQESMVTLSDEHDQHCWLPAAEAAALCLPALVGDQLLGVARLIGDPQAQPANRLAR